MANVTFDFDVTNPYTDTPFDFTIPGIVVIPPPVVQIGLSYPTKIPYFVIYGDVEVTVDYNWANIYAEILLSYSDDSNIKLSLFVPMLNAQTMRFKLPLILTTLTTDIIVQEVGFNEYCRYISSYSGECALLAAGFNPSASYASATVSAQFSASKVSNHSVYLTGFSVTDIFIDDIYTVGGPIREYIPWNPEDNTSTGGCAYQEEKPKENYVQHLITRRNNGSITYNEVSDIFGDANATFSHIRNLRSGYFNNIALLAFIGKLKLPGAEPMIFIFGISPTSGYLYKNIYAITKPGAVILAVSVTSSFGYVVVGYSDEDVSTELLILNLGGGIKKVENLDFCIGDKKYKAWITKSNDLYVLFASKLIVVSLSSSDKELHEFMFSGNFPPRAGELPPPPQPESE